MNNNMNINKVLSILYGVLILTVPFIYPNDTTSFINLCIPLIYFCLLHWIISQHKTGLKSEKVFSFLSIIAIIDLIVAFIFGFIGGESAGYMLLYLLIILPIPVILSLFFGLFSLYKTDRKDFYAFILSIPIILLIIYFVTPDLH